MPLITYAVDPHDVVQHIVVLPKLRLQIAHYHCDIFTRCLLIDSRELNAKVVLFSIRGLLDGYISLYYGDISYSTTEISGYKSFR